MSDPVRVTVDDGDETETALVSDDEGSVSAGDATVSFSVGSGDDTDGSEGDAAEADDSAGGDGDPTRIVALDAVPADSTVRFAAERADHDVDCILHRSGDAVVAWRNSCPHRPEVPLDRGTGAIVRGDDLVCHKHGAQFETGDGVCTHGPCAGDALDAVAVTVRDGGVYLTDDRYDGARALD